jgi:hypothetical protein
LQHVGRFTFILAVAFTVAWVALAGVYVARLGLASFIGMTVPDLALLLAAISGPPIAVWLIIAVFEQRRAIDHLIAQGRHGLQQSDTQARVLLQLHADAAHARSAEARALALHDLAAHAAVLAERLGVMTKDGVTAAWTRYGAGDVTVFVQAFLTFSLSHPDIAERMAEAVGRDGLARGALAGYVRRYQRLTSAMAGDKMAIEILDEGALGRGYRLFKQADELAMGAAAAGEAVAGVAQPEPVAEA